METNSGVKITYFGVDPALLPAVKEAVGRLEGTVKLSHLAEGARKPALWATGTGQSVLITPVRCHIKDFDSRNDRNQVSREDHTLTVTYEDTAYQLTKAGIDTVRYNPQPQQPQ